MAMCSAKWGSHVSRGECNGSGPSSCSRVLAMVGLSNHDNRNRSSFTPLQLLTTLGCRPWVPLLLDKWSVHLCNTCMARSCTNTCCSKHGAHNEPKMCTSSANVCTLCVGRHIDTLESAKANTDRFMFMVTCGPICCSNKAKGT